MTNLSDIKCPSCGEQLERVRYFARQLITADDMRLEQEYFREKARRHNRYLHGWGVVCGCTVERVADAKSWTVRVYPGYVFGPQGDEILIDNCRDVDLKLGATPDPCTVRWPCPPVGEMPSGDDRGLAVVHIAVRYAECFSRPVRVHPAGCGCDESICEYSRVRDSYELKVLWKLPDSHVNAPKDDQAWCTVLQEADDQLLERLHNFPVPSCPQCVLEPWVVLATVTFAATEQPGRANVSAMRISYQHRRTLLSVQSLQLAMTCMR
jgi:hypothetical protein